MEPPGCSGPRKAVWRRPGGGSPCQGINFQPLTEAGRTRRRLERAGSGRLLPASPLAVGGRSPQRCSALPQPGTTRSSTLSRCPAPVSPVPAAAAASARPFRETKLKGAGAPGGQESGGAVPFPSVHTAHPRCCIPSAAGTVSARGFPLRPAGTLFSGNPVPPPAGAGPRGRPRCRGPEEPRPTPGAGGGSSNIWLHPLVCFFFSPRGAAGTEQRCGERGWSSPGGGSPETRCGDAHRTLNTGKCASGARAGRSRARMRAPVRAHPETGRPAPPASSVPIGQRPVSTGPIGERRG